jgi:hypothetical protein
VDYILQMPKKLALRKVGFEAFQPPKEKAPWMAPAG